MKTRDRKDAEIVTIATGLLLGLAVVVAGGLALWLLQAVVGAGDDVLEPLATGVLVAALVVTADHVHRHHRG